MKLLQIIILVLVISPAIMFGMDQKTRELISNILDRSNNENTSFTSIQLNERKRRMLDCFREEYFSEVHDTLSRKEHSEILDSGKYII